MSMEKLTSILDKHGIIWKQASDNSVQTFSVANVNEFETLELVDGILYINGKVENIWRWLGY